MGKLAKDAKNLILGNDNSDKEPLDFKTELQNAIKSGEISKADGTLLITARANCDKFAEFISRTEEKEVIKASKENGKEFDSFEEAKAYEEEMKEKAKEKEEKEQKRQEEIKKQSLEEQIKASQNELKAKMASERTLQKPKEIDKNK